MKKGFFYSIFVIFILIFSSVTARGTIGQGYNVMTNPGEDMRTEMNISWHSDDKISFVQYTKASDTDWKDARLVLGMSEEFSVPESQQFGSKTVISDGFTPRYHLKVNLTGLEPDTEYKYRVGRDPSFSDTYYFKTGSGVEPFSFLAFTDPQYANDSGASIFNNLVQKALEIDPDIRFSVVSGDLVDRGGKIEQWNILFRQSSLRLMPFAVAPGNHEYYDASPTPVFFDNTYYKGFFNNPENGAEGVLGSSYYFKYNNVLFVSIDSEAAVNSAANKTAQKTWFENVMKSNHAQYIVVFMHRSFYGGIYGSVSADLRADWQGLFDKYGVDLVLTGHDHIYRRTTRIYEGEASTVDYRGTTYMISGSAGAKYYDLQYEGNNKYKELFEKEFARQSSVSIFQVGIDGLKLITIGTSGQYLDEVTLPAKRSPHPASGFAKESYLDSVKLTLDSKDPTKAVFYWGNQWYGHVNSARLHGEDGEVIGHEYFDTNKLGNTIQITDLEPNRTYQYTLKVEFKDGTTAEREINLLTKLSYGRIENLNLDVSGATPVLNWLAFLENDQIEKFRVLANDELVEELGPAAMSCDIGGLDPFRLNVITLEAVDKFGDVVYRESVEYGEDVTFTTTCPDIEIELEPGESKRPSVVVEPERDVTLVFESSDPEVAIVSADGEITAVAPGTATITVKIAEKPDVTCAIAVEVVEAKEKPGDAPKKKGCFGGFSAIAGLWCLGIAALLRRRRKYNIE